MADSKSNPKANAKSGANIPGGEYDFMKVFSDFRWPGVDMAAIAALQRENINAMMQVGQIVSENMNEISRRQTEIIRQTLEETMGVVEQTIETMPPDQRLAKQTAFAQMAFEKALANAREIADMMNKSNQVAGEVVKSRIAASVDEFRKIINQPE